MIYSYSRRQVLSGAVGVGAMAPLAVAKRAPSQPDSEVGPRLDGTVGGEGYRPVVTPNGSTLPYRMVDGVKVFHLIAEPVWHEFTDGLGGECWGYNGQVHGPTIEAVQGDRVRIYVTNRLAVSTTAHWHGLPVPSGMDGVGGLSQRPIEPGETFKYEFQLTTHGTYMYHSHHDEMVQMAMGLMGMFVIHPRDPEGPLPDRDYVYLLSEWAIQPGERRPDPNEMTDFNVLTFNAKVFPGTAPMVARLGERVRIRIGNLSGMDHHPIHFHGTSVQVVATDGGDIPLAGRWPETSVLVPTGTTRTIELMADNPGDWAVHCHMTHHTMTQMGHGVPNLTGVDPTAFDAALMAVVPEFGKVNDALMSGEDEDATGLPKNSVPMMGGSGPNGYISMGGMFTMLKIREQIDEGVDPGWYRPPKGTQAAVASEEELGRDGIVT